MRATDFLNTLGVNTHIDSAPYDNTARIAGALSYLGIENVRQSSPIDAASLAGMTALGQTGAKIDLIINGGGPVSLTGAMANVYALAPYLNAVENVNEVAIYPIEYAGLSGVDAAVALQKDLYAAVKSNPTTAQLPVYDFTIGGADPSAYPSIGDISQWTDFANIHSYPPQGLRPIFVIHAAIDGGRTDAPSKPVVVTETGYYTLPNSVGWGGVPESQQASYLIDEVLDEAAAGVSRTYLYDLLDDGADTAGINQEDHFGLFHVDGTPKPSATAIHNLTRILADSGVSAKTFTPSAFAYSATGVPYNYTGNSFVLDKSDGSHVIAVWNEEQLWNTSTLTASAPQHFATTVDLKASYNTVLVFDPMVGSSPIETLHNVSTVNLDLTDHPFLIQVLPNAPASLPPLAPLDTLTIHVSEDAYLGNAKFQVIVDGVSVGGALTATASHAAGQTQDVTLTGAFGATAHTIGVQFLNDAWGGTPQTDRNLYVDGMTLDGSAVAGSDRVQDANGTATVQLGQPATSHLTFNVSEDAWNGDAVAKFYVDGNQVGAATTVTASHQLGQVQAMAFIVPVGPGPHTASVAFTNDAWGGTPATDRNLYVNSIAVDGAIIPKSAATLYSNGTTSVSFAAQPAPMTAFTLTQNPPYLIAAH